MVERGLHCQTELIEESLLYNMKEGTSTMFSMAMPPLMNNITIRALAN